MNPEVRPIGVPAPSHSFCACDFKSLDLSGSCGAAGGWREFPGTVWGGQGRGPSCVSPPAFSLGMAVLRSTEPLALGRWHRVSAERLNKDGSLRVDGGRPVLRSSPGKSQGLNLHTLLYLGGVEPSVQLSPAVNMSTPFRGCLGEVRSSFQRTRRGGVRTRLPHLQLAEGPWEQKLHL